VPNSSLASSYLLSQPPPPQQQMSAGLVQQPTGRVLPHFETFQNIRQPKIHKFRGDFGKQKTTLLNRGGGEGGVRTFDVYSRKELFNELDQKIGEQGAGAGAGAGGVEGDINSNRPGNVQPALENTSSLAQKILSRMRADNADGSVPFSKAFNEARQ